MHTTVFFNMKAIHVGGICDFLQATLSIAASAVKHERHQDLEPLSRSCFFDSNDSVWNAVALYLPCSLCNQTSVYLRQSRRYHSRWTFDGMYVIFKQINNDANVKRTFSTEDVPSQCIPML